MVQLSTIHLRLHRYRKSHQGDKELSTAPLRRNTRVPEIRADDILPDYTNKQALFFNFKSRTGDVAQWKSACSAYRRPRDWSPNEIVIKLESQKIRVSFSLREVLTKCSCSYLIRCQPLAIVT